MTNDVSPLHAPPIIWVLAADGDEACLYRLHEEEERTELALEPIPDITLRAEKIYDYDKGKHGATSPAVEPHQSTHEEVELRFMRTIAVKLNHGFARKLFDSLVIVIPAPLLSEIKKHLEWDVLDCVLTEIPAELAPYATKELRQHIKLGLVTARIQAA